MDKDKPKLEIKRSLAALDNRDRDFYNNLTDEERKALGFFILMRYSSSCQGGPALQKWFLERTNTYVNKNHWLLSKDHKELLWKLFASIGTGTVMYHPYLAAGKKEKANKIEKLIAELYPAMKMQDIKLLASKMSKKDKEELFDKMGFDKKQRKEYE